MTKTETVTMDDLIKRINKALAPAGRKLRKSSERERGVDSGYTKDDGTKVATQTGLGAYHEIDAYSGNVRDHHVDPAAIADELGLLQAHERLEG